MLVVSVRRRRATLSCGFPEMARTSDKERGAAQRAAPEECDRCTLPLLEGSCKPVHEARRFDTCTKPRCKCQIPKSDIALARFSRRDNRPRSRYPRYRWHFIGMYHFVVMSQTRMRESEDGDASNSLARANELLIRQELASLLKHPLFAKSKRYPKFLRFIVEKSLSQDLASLKERVIGIELLGKQGDYDNAADPEVRNIASEVRKRLSLYYQNNPEHQVRIELPAGSYIPLFHGLVQAPTETAPPAETMTSTATVPDEVIEDSTHTTGAEAVRSETPAQPMRHSRWLLATVAVLVVLVVLGAILGVRFWRNVRNATKQTVQDQFWAQMFHSGSPVVLVIGTRGARQAASNTNDRSLTPSPATTPTVSIDSAAALSRITVFLGTHGENYEIHPVLETQYAMLRDHPSVLIGGLNNAWVLRLLEHARYRLEFDSKSARSSVLDTTTGRSWVGPQFGVVEPAEHMDYAIVVREKDTTTGGNVIIVAGLGSAGTVAAAEFVTDAKYLQQLSPARMGQNVELVLATDVIDTVPGPPRIIATHSWR